MEFALSDPDCAICFAPASLACLCEADYHDNALQQAESQVMQRMYDDIRSWVRAHAEEYILKYYQHLIELRKEAHRDRLERLTEHIPHVRAQSEEIEAANTALLQGVGDDWQGAIGKIPAVFEYFYSLVALSLPGDQEPQVKDVPLGMLDAFPEVGGRLAALTSASQYDFQGATLVGTTTKESPHIHARKRTPSLENSPPRPPFPMLPSPPNHPLLPRSYHPRPSRRSVGFVDQPGHTSEDFRGDEGLFHDTAPNASSYQLQHQVVERRPRQQRSVAAYDTLENSIMPTTTQARQASMYSSGLRSSGPSPDDQRYIDTLKYQEAVSASHVPLTAESLREAGRRAQNRDSRADGRSMATGTTRTFVNSDA
ncbi:hypothetical protein VFPPC_09003 [Pochonia chlamydosporia 170]|uniref:Uncharacterized protein n=1 Tax=Pochonia chlamydosporia 170 TaxID=1380566 RepID=A0A179FCS5_METCM|nr:hypothetical protein VFPPC_09003 [Pochonia chlamydosporia 170]OAQ63100.1 hypothetical protein VFPPC_09003 [Pochonia chlamydosporia 170]